MTADWSAVVGITYAADEDGLAAYLPPGAEIDRLGGAARVSRERRLWDAAHALRASCVRRCA
jgi:hypothetical protein